MLDFAGRYLDEIDKGPQWRRHKPASGIIEIRPRETLPPGFEDRLERAAFKVWPQPILEQGHDAGARDRNIDEQISGAAEAHRQRARHVDLDDLTIALELPVHGRPAWKAALQAGMAEQVARVLRSASSIEIGRGGAQRKALLTRTDR